MTVALLFLLVRLIMIPLQDLEQARAEIRNLRKVARDFQNQLRGNLLQLGSSSPRTN